MLEKQRTQLRAGEGESEYPIKGTAGTRSRVEGKESWHLGSGNGQVCVEISTYVAWRWGKLGKVGRNFVLFPLYSIFWYCWKLLTVTLCPYVHTSIKDIYLSISIYPYSC